MVDDAPRRKKSVGGSSFKRSPSLRSQETSFSIAEIIDVQAGDWVEAVALVTVRSGESLETEQVTVLQRGTVFQVEALGKGRRIKIKTGGTQGWISTKTKSNEPLIMKHVDPIGLLAQSLEEFKVGGKHQVLCSVTVRESEDLGSRVITDLVPGSVVTIEEISSSNPRRARVAEGWVSMATKDGEILLGSMLDGSNPAGNFSGGPSSEKIKDMLEAARSGNLEVIRNAAMDKTKTVRGMPKQFNYLNACDIRGKTPLIYASAFGHLDIVDFLVSREDVDVHATDDTQKNALHHACKRARQKRSALEQTQADIVSKLMRAGICIDARDHNGCTALMFAVGNGDVDVTRILLQAKANVNKKDFEGYSPMDYALNFEHRDIAQLLKEYGAEDSEFNLDAILQEYEAEAAAEAAALEEKRKKSGRERAKTDDKGHAKTSIVSKLSLSTSASSDKAKEPKTPRAGKAGAAKGTAKAKAGAAKRKVKGKAFQEIIREDQEGDKDATIAVLPDETEEISEAERQRRRLEVAITSDIDITALQTAVRAAEDAGVDRDVIAQAYAVLEGRSAAEEVRKSLYDAMAEGDVQHLQEAIVAAEQAGLPKKEVDKAKAALAVEIPKESARAQLKEAQSSGDVESLKSAIQAAKAANVPARELVMFEELLENVKSKSKVESSLAKAATSKDVAQLRILVKQAKELGIDASAIAQAEVVLQEEEPKLLAREKISKGMAKSDREMLQDAVEAARAAMLPQDEIQEALEAITLLEAKERGVKKLKEVVDSVQDTDMKSIQALKEAKRILSNGISEARASGVPEKSLKEAELKRRKFHNTIENLKGAIRVFCRVRPLNTSEKKQEAVAITEKVDAMTLKVNKERFVFDSVFAPGTQDEVFEDCRDLVQSAADGYNVTMFAYGQTGAGKTFTMYGEEGNRGTAPRTIEELFRVTEENSDRYTYTIMGSMLELYHQNLVDLIAKARGVQADGNLEIHVHKGGGGVVVENMIEQEVNSAQELEALLNEGNCQRTVKATAMNADSSRSHSILIIQVISVNKETGAQLRGKILIVDLAGSERLKKSAVEKEMAKEAIEINKSLTALGDVIQGLTQNDKVIPYRNHKLTQLMQDSLGGTAKTLMFVNCSPASVNQDETLMSLKWATRAKKVKNDKK